jgi:hypothetical protein
MKGTLAKLEDKFKGNVYMGGYEYCLAVSLFLCVVFCRISSVMGVRHKVEPGPESE